MSLRLVAFVAVLASITVSAAADQAPARDGASASAPTGIIRGVVTAADTGKPIRGAEVYVEGDNIPRLEPRRAVTDEEGRYEVRALEPGRYTVSASRVGYVTLAYGQRRPGEGPRQVDVVESGAVERLNLILPRGSTIVARLTDQHGEPLAGIMVRPFESKFVDGHRRLEPFVAAGLNATDDRGEVRLFGLPPGSYYVVAAASEPQREYAETLYPGTPWETEARPIRVGLGEEVLATFPMIRARAARLSGVISSASGALVSPPVTLTRRQLASISTYPITVLESGTFTAENLPPGDYVIRVRSPEPASITVRVFGEDVSGVIVATKPSPRVRGRIVFESPDSPGVLTPKDLSIRLATTPPTFPVAPVLPIATNWTFEMPGMSGVGVLQLRPTPASRAWSLKAVLLDGRDVTETPLDVAEFDGRRVEIVLTQRLGALSGTVFDARGTATRDCAVVFFPQDSERWTPYGQGVGSVRPNEQGRFEITGLPPGRYLLAVVDYLEVGDERNPETLSRLRSSATAVSLSERESRTIDLRLAR